VRSRDAATTWHVRLSDHARRRARERLSVGPSVILDDVTEAIHAGRLSPDPPLGLWGRWHGLYYWTASGDRIYVVGAGSQAFTVLTAIAPNGSAA
jgi:hypothetical protein